MAGAALTFPFACIPQAATMDINLSDSGYRVYSAFVSLKNRKTGQLNPWEKNLATAVGKSLRTVQRAVKELRSAGMVVIHRTLFGNHYEITTPDKWCKRQNHAPVTLADPPKMADADPPKMADACRQKWQVQGDLSLYEPEEYEPERTHTVAEAVRPLPAEPGVCVLALVINQSAPNPRFEEFWAKYPLKQNFDGARQTWDAVVMPGQEPLALACLGRYLESDWVARGIGIPLPHKWLAAQARDQWRGDWPKRIQPQRAGRVDGTQAVLDLMARRMANGRPPL